MIDNGHPLNRLADETSPYLLAHSHDPVDWYAWGKDALARAEAEDRPIHLSIGYSACHWCNVLHRESFQDSNTAALLNRHFINIKVDREERPDLDRIYQIAHQMLAQRNGGWPLTMFLTPQDRLPFFGGTYFPDQPRQGMPAFKEILQRVATYYREHRDEIRQQNEALAEAFATLNPPPAQDALTPQPLQAARAILEDEFDREFGGFGTAPKFPHPPTLEFLLRCWRDSGEENPDLHALFMATLTCKRMAEGGLFDRLGGGFFRYAVDRYWSIPHFEKMLYDNGALLAVYAQAALATGDALYARAAARTADWLLREMQDPQGGFYASLDADSEGHEGLFYVWNRDEVRRLLTNEEYALLEKHYGLARVANFEGRWHLQIFDPVESMAGKEQQIPAIQAAIDAAGGKLLLARDRRPRPHRDEKILAGWNALAIRGLAVTARALDRDDLAGAAGRALHFIQTHLWRQGRLRVSYKDGRAPLPAYLDDYVFLIDAILELQQCRWRSDEFSFAMELMDVVLERFADREAGGFFFTAEDHDQLIHRSRSFGDDATPSGNAIAAKVLNRLGLLLGETRYLQAAERTLKAGWNPLQRYPQGHAALLMALEEYLDPVQTVIIRGAGEEADQWRKQLGKIYAPCRMIFSIPFDVQDLPAAILDLPAALANKTPLDGTVAYLCHGTRCLPPIHSFDALADALQKC